MSRELCVSQGVTVVRGLPAGEAASSAGVRGGVKKNFGLRGGAGRVPSAPRRSPCGLLWGVGRAVVVAAAAAVVVVTRVGEYRTQVSRGATAQR